MRLVYVDDITTAIGSGLDYLHSRRSADGFWRDFAIAGESDMWTTAFVGSLLAEMDDSRAQDMAQQALEWLLQTDPAERWAYSPDAARDADTTAWVLRLWERLRVAGDELCDGYKFLESHLTSTGGISTFSSVDFVEKFGRDIDRRGWYSAHTCVTAAAAALKQTEGSTRVRLLQYLRSSQNTGGYWTGYWWIDDLYTTALSVEALSATGQLKDIERVRRASTWVLGCIADTGRVTTLQHPEGSPFATALAVRALSHADFAGRASSTAGDWLVRAQQGDGSWRSSARLRLPMPNEVVVDESRWLRQPSRPTRWNAALLDQHRLHTTAMVVNALFLLVANR